MHAAADNKWRYVSERAGSAIHPVSTGPIDCPMPNAMMKTATAGPHTDLGRDPLIKSAIATERFVADQNP
jgi:hypothetical protein